MPLTNAARIWAMKREAERNLAAKLAEQEKNRAAQQALTVPALEHHRPDPAPPEVTARRAVPDQGGSGPNRVSQHQDRAARQVDQPVLGHQEPDSDLDSSASDDRTSARDRLRAAGLDRPATRSIAERTGHGTDQRLEHPPGTKDGVEGHHVIAAVTAATAPPKNPKAQAPLVDEPLHRAVTAAKRAVDPDHRSGPESAPRDLRPDPDRHQAGRASELPRNLQAEAALERLKEQLDHAQAKRAQQLEDEIKAMRELIAGRLEKDDRPVSEIMVDLIFDGLEGKVVLAESIGGRRRKADR